MTYRTRRGSSISWIGSEVNTTKIYYCENDNYVLHWLEEEKQFICVRCGHRYDPEIKKPKMEEEEQVLQVAGRGGASRKPAMIQAKDNKSRIKEYYDKKHGAQVGDWEDKMLEKSSPGLKITESRVLSRGDDTLRLRK